MNPTTSAFFFATTAIEKHQHCNEIVIMPRNVKKENLPTKICVVCNRPFTWRKKWEKVWDEVSTCSKSCNRKRRLEKQQGNYKRNQEKRMQNQEQAAVSTELINSSLLSKEPENLNEQTISDLNDWMVNLQIVDESLENDNGELEVNSNDSVASSIQAKKAARNQKSDEAKAERKKAKKLAKAKRRAERQGKGDPSAGQKQCDVCGKSVDLLIRCTIDESKQWKLVCGKCWNDVSGGVVDGDTSHPYYRYGGLWKNRRAQK